MNILPENLRRYGMVLCWALSLTLFTLPLQAAELSTGWTIDQLMQLLAKTRSGHASFVETKSIAMLDKPVESSGELFYKAPDYLEKRTMKPKAESMILSGSKLILERGSKKRTVQLQSYPEIAAFIDSIRGTLAGDRKSLEHTYNLALEGNAQSWKLQLTPIDSKMKKIVERITISGVNNEAHTIEISQADGDSSLMVIESIAVE